MVECGPSKAKTMEFDSPHPLHKLVHEEMHLVFIYN